uniref:Uncharacterized protein n=1 Tax=Plectus sambesii TaxID=2011161 RepID=A0A914XLT9_9BILA
MRRWRRRDDGTTAGHRRKLGGDARVWAILPSEERNLKALQRAVAQVFKLQPALLDDLKKDGEIVSQLLHKAANEAERAAAAQGRQRVFHMKTTELDMRAIVELCAYLVDVASTLTAFVTVFPDALRVFHQVGLTSELPSITERLCVSLAAELFFRIAKSGFSVNVRLLIGQLESFKKSTVQLFRQLLEKNAIYDPTLPADEAQKRAEDFVGLITAALDCENFIFVYNDVYPLETDLKQLLVNQLCTQPTIDYVRATLETICAKQVEMLKQKLRRRGLFQVNRSSKFETARLNEQVQLVEEVDALPASARRRPPRPDEEPRPFTADYTGGRSRQLKERNKGFVAGHNRKAGAMKKMRQGMI